MPVNVPLSWLCLQSIKTHSFVRETHEKSGPCCCTSDFSLEGCSFSLLQNTSLSLRCSLRNTRISGANGIEKWGKNGEIHLKGKIQKMWAIPAPQTNLFHWWHCCSLVNILGAFRSAFTYKHGQEYKVIQNLSKTSATLPLSGLSVKCMNWTSDRILS